STPYCARLRHGFVAPLRPMALDYTLRLQPGTAGVRHASSIRSRGDRVGTIIYGPHRHLLAGRYRIALKVSVDPCEDARAHEPVAVLEIASRVRYIAHKLITPADIAYGKIELEIDVVEKLALDPDFAFETRLRSLEPLNVQILELTCERLSDAVTAANDLVP